MQALQLLTCNEVASLLRVSPETVRQLAAAGELPGRKVGRAWRFLRKSLETYLLAGAETRGAKLPSNRDITDRIT